MHVCFNNHWKSLPTGKLFLVAPPARTRAVFGRYVMKCYQQQAVVIFDATFPGEKKKKGLKTQRWSQKCIQTTAKHSSHKPDLESLLSGNGFCVCFCLHVTGICLVILIMCVN